MRPYVHVVSLFCHPTCCVFVWMLKGTSHTAPTHPPIPTRLTKPPLFLYSVYVCVCNRESGRRHSAGAGRSTAPQTSTTSTTATSTSTRRSSARTTSTPWRSGKTSREEPLSECATKTNSRARSAGCQASVLFSSRGWKWFVAAHVVAVWCCVWVSGSFFKGTYDKRWRKM